MTGAVASTPSRWTPLRQWARRVNLGRKFAYLLVVAAVASGLTTLAAMTGGQTSTGPDPRTVIMLLYLDAVLLLLLGGIVAYRVAKVWAERRRGLAGSGLHVRLMLLFGLVAVTPAVLVAIFAAVFLNIGVQAWFSERVQTALDAAHNVAMAYLQEHKQSIVADTLAMANDLNHQAAALARNPRLFSQFVSTQARIRSLAEAIVVDSQGRVLARSELSFSLEFKLVPPWVFEKADQGEIVPLTSEGDDRVRAVVKLDRFVDAYLVVGRYADSRVLEHIERTQGAESEYRMLEKQRDKFQITFVLIFVVVAVLLLLAAQWLGMMLATRLSRPISSLIEAAGRVSEGDLRARVDDTSSTDEIAALGRAFNHMTGQLKSQQEGLIDANRELDERRRFTETVLEGVSAGVIGLDATGRVTLPNRSASELLGLDLTHARGARLGETVPEMAPLLAQVMARPERLGQAEINVTRGGRALTLLVRVAAERLEGTILGYIVTFDDITELQSAQRTAAWADVARRIAHEIKNPLTPIQLSAERLKRRYLKEITSEPETFKACTETIVRQVEDIGRMVDEFSAFARMPQAELKDENLTTICRESVFLESNRHAAIAFRTQFPDAAVMLRCDRRQVTRALNNLLKNAAESVEARLVRDAKDGGAGGERGLVELRVEADPANVRVWIEDNGLGLPQEHRDRLTEPYVTTRAKGTGLGLAIVKKIVEDHHGDLVLEDGPHGGARACMVFGPPAETPAGPPPRPDDSEQQQRAQAHGT
ncbi:MAG: PAS domain-containing sensor histidine kinase [Hyphomicrobiales bacterium]|nr:PAS domain-containing sensor histidine kinase [Hyphomicrobiales bacterium]